MRFELPEELEGLEEPSFILLTPLGIQYGFISAITVFSLAALGWFLISLLGTGTVSGGQSFCVILSLPGLLVCSHRSNWRRWATFACDRNGVYLGRTSPSNFTFKPWSDVGGAYIGKADGSTDVILKVRFSKDEWYKHIGHDWDYPVREDGYVHCGTGQQCRSVNNTLNSILNVWKLSEAASYYRLNMPAEVVRPSKLETALPAICALLACSVLFALGYFGSESVVKRAMRNRDLVASGMKASGTILEMKTAGSRHKDYWPVVSFVAADGREFQFESLHRPNYTGNVAGDPVQVLYDPHDPTIAEIDDPERLWGGVRSRLTVGAILLLIGGGGIIYTLSRGFPGGKKVS